MHVAATSKKERLYNYFERHFLYIREEEMYNIYKIQVFSSSMQDSYNTMFHVVLSSNLESWKGQQVYTA